MARSIQALSESLVGRKAEFGRVTAFRERDSIIFTSTAESGGQERTLAVDASPFEVVFPDGRLRGEFLPAAGANVRGAAPEEAFLDADKVQSPIAVRTWMAGDRFRPLGSGGTQKLKSFLTNRKVPAWQRPNVRVVESAGEIAWVVGLQIDDRFKVGPETRRMLHLSWQMSPDAKKD